MYLQLRKSESTTGSNTTIVLDGRTSHKRSELVDWARGDSCCFLETGSTAALLATRLYFRLVTVLLLRMKSLEWHFETIPGQSERGHDVANPCGSLDRFVRDFGFFLTPSEDAD